MKFVLALVFIGGMAVPTFAQAPNGAAMIKTCAAKKGTQASDNCMSYVNGFLAGILADQISNEHGTPICLPEGAPTEQIKDALTGFLYAHPQTWRASGNAAYEIALEMMYPCKK